MNLRWTQRFDGNSIITGFDIEYKNKSGTQLSHQGPSCPARAPGTAPGSRGCPLGGHASTAPVASKGRDTGGTQTQGADGGSIANEEGS